MKKNNLVDLIFSIIFSASQIIGFNALKYDDTFINKLSTYVDILILSIFIYIILIILKKIKLPNKNYKIYDLLFNHKYSFWLLIILILLSWLPYLLAFYPGNFSYDAGTQVRMANGTDIISKYHPIIHTFFIYLTILNGFKIFSSYNIGVFIYSLLQSIIMSSIFVYTLLFLNKKNVPQILNIIFLLFYMFLPTHAIYAITTTKDILFAGIFNLAIIELIKLCENNELINDKKFNIKFIIIMLLLIMFRNNMLYSFLIFIPFFLIFMKKYFKKSLMIMFLIIILFFSYDKFLTYGLNIGHGPRIEAFSFVVQQFARVYHKETLSEKEKNDIIALYKNDAINYYDSHISDPIKKEFNSEILFANKLKYMKLYFKYLIKYPKTFIDSILINTYGFYYLGDKYPDQSGRKYVEINCLTVDNGVVLRTYDCKKNIPKLYDYFFNLLDQGKYQNNIILNIIMNPAVYFFVFIYILIYEINTKQKKLLLPLILIGLYMLTNFLAPVSLVRYIYFLFTLFPLLILIYIKKNNSLH